MAWCGCSSDCDPFAVDIGVPPVMMRYHPDQYVEFQTPSKRWVPAKPISLSEDGLYTLDCCDGVDEKNIRARPSTPSEVDVRLKAEAMWAESQVMRETQKQLEMEREAHGKMKKSLDEQAEAIGKQRDEEKSVHNTTMSALNEYLRNLEEKKKHIDEVQDLNETLAELKSKHDSLLNSAGSQNIEELLARKDQEEEKLNEIKQKLEEAREANKQAKSRIQALEKTAKNKRDRQICVVQ